MCDDSTMSDADFQPGLDIAALPLVVKNRVKALKKLQFETVKQEEEYYKEVHALNLKYQKMYDEINSKRFNVISGKHEPTGEEIEWASEDGGEDDKKEKGDDLSEGVKKININDYTENTKGIPKFWYHALRHANDDILMGMIAPYDEPVLEHLVNLTVSLSSPDNTGFSLQFHFSENDYFTNSVLTKDYSLRPGHDTDCPLEYDGPEIYKAVGCQIDWKEGKNLTTRTVEIKEKSTKKGSKKDVAKEIILDSFFNFFSPPELPKDPEEELSDEDRATLAVDFDLGFAIKEKIIPRAVLYFTGEIIDEDEFEDCSDESEDEDVD